MSTDMRIACPSCGYTERDAVVHGDHHLCGRHNEMVVMWDEEQGRTPKPTPGPLARELERSLRSDRRVDSVGEKDAFLVIRIDLLNRILAYLREAGA